MMSPRGISDFLQAMRAQSLARVASARAECGDAHMRRRALASAQPLGLAAQAVGFDLIAEVKHRSPSAGKLAASDEDPAARATMYASAGAAMVSVLTEPEQFGGSLEHLAEISEALRPMRVPTLRKDFLVDPYQIYEARASGASGVLLIVRLLDDGTANAMLSAAAESGLFVLLEAFDAADLARAARLRRAGAQLVYGVNTRDLRTLEVRGSRLAELARHFPDGAVRVAESGILGARDAAAAAALGYRYALVGTALMRSPDPARLIDDMLAAARREREPLCASA